MLTTIISVVIQNVLGLGFEFVCLYILFFFLIQRYTSYSFKENKYSYRHIHAPRERESDLDSDFSINRFKWSRRRRRKNVLLQSLLLFCDGHLKVLLLIYTIFLFFFFFFIRSLLSWNESPSLSRWIKKATSWKIIAILIVASFCRMRTCWMSECCFLFQKRSFVLFSSGINCLECIKFKEVSYSMRDILTSSLVFLYQVHNHAFRN